MMKISRLKSILILVCASSWLFFCAFWQLSLNYLVLQQMKQLQQPSQTENDGQRSCQQGHTDGGGGGGLLQAQK